MKVLEACVRWPAAQSGTVRTRLPSAREPRRPRNRVNRVAPCYTGCRYRSCARTPYIRFTEAGPRSARFGRRIEIECRVTLDEWLPLHLCPSRDGVGPECRQECTSRPAPSVTVFVRSRPCSSGDRETAPPGPGRITHIHRRHVVGAARRAAGTPARPPGIAVSAIRGRLSNREKLGMDQVFVV